METVFYKKREGRFISGVLAGLSDKFHWDVSLARILTAIFMYFSFGFGLFLYIVLAIFLPYKEDIEKERYGTGPRKRKEAEPVKDDNDWFF
ncbi:PspC domain-containing protein [Streptococcus hillyeri]|uniref:PspC domain-containing protein n=1 Tax=Streptococcus hillyeri TaxID=2282420 RepID=A0A3L9DTI2_9STRE|nr:PspC domain-containing protein [Streptococcus hillyeri]RLY04746.1 PspC domain-containing protein [Streptococcus hillyeri]